MEGDLNAYNNHYQLHVNTEIDKNVTFDESVKYSGMVNYSAISIELLRANPKYSLIID